MFCTFFYGSWIDLEILKKKDIFPERYEIGRLHGFEITIRPIANLIQNDSTLVYGILLWHSREKHQRILTDLTQGVMGKVYLPQAILAETLDGKWQPALCYLADKDEAKKPNPEYIEPLIKSAQKWGFPEWYVKHIESFRR